MDVEYGLVEGFPREFEQSLFVLATVMSRPTPERAVLDAGLKALSIDKGMPGVRGLARVEYQRASDEHGVLRLGTPRARRAPARRSRLADPRALRSHDQPPRLVRRRAWRPGRGALADHRPRRHVVTAARRTGPVAGRPAAWLEAGAGPPLILVHGAGGSAELWQPQLEGLADVARVVAPDLPGHGPLGGRGGPSIAWYADWLAAFVAALGTGGVVLVGHSMGGAIAQAFALAQPERLAGLVLIATARGSRCSPASSISCVSAPARGSASSGTSRSRPTRRRSAWPSSIASCARPRLS